MNQYSTNKNTKREDEKQTI